MRLLSAFGTAEPGFASLTLSGIINAACEGSPARLPGSGPINDALAATTGVGARDEIEGMPLPALAGLGWPLIIPPCISATISDDRFALDRDPEIPLWQHADVRPLELGFSRKLDGDGPPAIETRKCVGTAEAAFPSGRRCPTG